MKLVRIQELLEIFPEFREYQPKLETMPDCVFNFIYCGPEVLMNAKIPLIMRCTGCMAPIDQAIECDKKYVKKHLFLLIHSKNYLKDQVYHIEELHAFWREISKVDAAIKRESTEVGNKIARNLAIDFIGKARVKEIEKNGRTRVLAKNGKFYWVKKSGVIHRYKSRRRKLACTHVGDIKIPWDLVVCHIALLKNDKSFCNMVERNIREN